MKASEKALAASTAILLLTAFHHFYAAAIYDTPWRRHVAVVVAPVLLVMLAAYTIYRLRPLTQTGKVSLLLFMLVALLAPVAWLGFYHGGYTHLVRIVLFFGGVSPALFEQFFPPPLFVAPDDLVYEVTGVIEFLLALYAAYYLYRTWQDNRVDSRTMPTPAH